jgi:hypothetical protein
MPLTDWIGLPHLVGADPRKGEGADCLLLSFALAEEAGLEHPPLPANLFRWYRLGKIGDLAALFLEHSEPVEAPTEGCIAIRVQPGAMLGVCTFTDGGVAYVSEETGVAWVPAHRLPGLSWRRWVA